MDLTFLDRFLWAASFIGNVALLLVLLVRGRWRHFPVITGYMAFELVSTIVLYSIYRYGSFRAYNWAYWCFAFLDFVLQLGLMFEITRVVLKPTGTWVSDAKGIFTILGIIAVSLATGVALMVRPALSTGLQCWAVRGELFTSMIICEVFLMVMIVSSHLGLFWRNHVMGFGQGLSIWALVALLVDTAHSFLSMHYYTTLEHVRIFSYLAALVYWIITFWREEPERRELTPEMQAYLAGLHQTVQDELSKVVIPQHRE